MQHYDPVAPPYGYAPSQPDGAWPQPHPQPAAPSKPASRAPAVIAIVLSVLAIGPLGLAIFNLEQADGKLPPGTHERDEVSDKRSGDRDPARTDQGALPVPSAEAPVANARQGAFRLGRQVGLAALGRARGQAAAADRLFARAQQHAKDLGVTLRPLPVLSGDETKDTADALHYLLETVGKPVASTLSSKHGPAHAAAFELGIKLNLLSVLYPPDDELGQGPGPTCDELAQGAGVSASTVEPLLSKIRGNASQAVVGDTAVHVGDAVDRELASATAAPPAVPQKQPPRPLDADARLH